MEFQIFRFAKIILFDRYNISYNVVLFFRDRYNIFVRWNFSLIVSSVLFVFPLLKEISQNYFLFNIIKWKNFKKIVEIFYLRFC